MTMINFNNVTLQYDSGATIRNVNFSLKRGEFAYLIGPSGSGKSSILRMIYMDLFPNIGEVKVGDFNCNTIKRRHIPKLRRKVGMIFQDYLLLNDRNVYQNVSLALEIQGVKTKEIERRVHRALNEVGLLQKKTQFPYELSGGEQQRVSIARAVVKDPLVLLADEPTGNLDYGVSLEILKLLWRFHEKGTAVIMATHNLELIRDYPARTLRISNGIIKGDVTP
mgnify:FL=1|jgi:cell division transport system ATP-binding protein